MLICLPYLLIWYHNIYNTFVFVIEPNFIHIAYMFGWRRLFFQNNKMGVWRDARIVIIVPTYHCSWRSTHNIYMELFHPKNNSTLISFYFNENLWSFLFLFFYVNLIKMRILLRKEARNFISAQKKLTNFFCKIINKKKPVSLAIWLYRTFSFTGHGK